jgi:hypothetical protein
MCWIIGGVLVALVYMLAWSLCRAAATDDGEGW